MDVLKTLRDEVNNDPLSRGYAAMNNAERSASLNAKDRSIKIPIPSTEILAWSAQSSASDRPRIIKLEEAAASHASEAIKAISKASLEMIKRDGTALDLNLPDRMQMVDALVAGGALSANDKTSLVTLATKTVSRAEELGLPEISESLLQSAGVI